MATATIVAFYTDFRTARKVMEELAAEGIDRDRISIIGPEASNRHGVATAADVPPGRTGVNLSGIGPVVAIGPIERELANSNIEQVLRTRNVPAPEVERVAEGLRRGGALVVADVAPGDHDRALVVIDRHHPGGIDTMQQSYPEPGWSRQDQVTGPRGALEVADDLLHVKRPGEASEAFRTLAPTPEELTPGQERPVEEPGGSKGGSRAGPGR